MSAATQYKVVIEGQNIVDRTPIKLVKIGSFRKDEEGIQQAVESAMLDKYGSDIDMSECLPILLMSAPSTREDTTLFAVVLQQMGHTGRNIVAVYHALVSFKTLEMRGDA